MALRVRLLGVAAGGGLPQWNCRCEPCAAARSGLLASRTQSSIAVSADGKRWLLLNASPDIRTQLNAYPSFGPPEGTLRGSGIAAVLVTNADIDHTAGLLVLREGGAPPIYCTKAVQRALTEGLSILPVIAAYGPTQVREVVPEQSFEPCDRAGNSLGFRVEPFALAAKPPPYMLARLGSDTRDEQERLGDVLGLRIATPDGGVLVYAPGVRNLDAAFAEKLRDARLILHDGTTFTNDELVRKGLTTRTAKDMGHASLHGEDGTLAFLSQFSNARRVLVHVNNTNPIWIKESPERASLQEYGVELGDDGMEFVV